ERCLRHVGALQLHRKIPARRWFKCQLQFQDVPSVIPAFHGLEVAFERSLDVSRAEEQTLLNDEAWVEAKGVLCKDETFRGLVFSDVQLQKGLFIPLAIAPFDELIARNMACCCVAPS